MRLEDRLASITKCMDEIAGIRQYPPNALLNTIGQCDWLFELHRLLHEEGYKWQTNIPARNVAPTSVTTP